MAVILVPRQCGKTTFALDLAIGRCLAEANRDRIPYAVAYTAQTGHVTTERMTERMAQLGSTSIARRAKLRRSQGTERITFRNEAFVKAFPPKPGALRGSTLDLVIVDEVQEIPAELGVALDQEILPTQQNRPRRQVILIGTAGTDASAYLARHLAAARAGAPEYALLEYGADDADDVTDPDVWDRVHPGLAAGLTDRAALSTALAVMGPDSFAREYLNRWLTVSDRVIAPADWAAIRHRDGTPADRGAPGARYRRGPGPHRGRGGGLLARHRRHPDPRGGPVRPGHRVGRRVRATPAGRTLGARWSRRTPPARCSPSPTN